MYTKWLYFKYPEFSFTWHLINQISLFSYQWPRFSHRWNFSPIVQRLPTPFRNAKTGIYLREYDPYTMAHYDVFAKQEKSVIYPARLETCRSVRDLSMSTFSGFFSPCMLLPTGLKVSRSVVRRNKPGLLLPFNYALKQRDCLGRSQY